MNANLQQDPLLSGLALGEKRFVGDWQVLKVVGRGGFGWAYAVEKSVVIGQEVVPVSAVLKTVNVINVDSRSAQSALVNEIKQLSKINSRYVANLRDAGLHFIGNQHVPFLVVDYIEGGSLSQMIRQRFAQHRTGLPSTVFKTLVENTLRALASAHNENVLHLDIKPANIIYSATDDAFVLIDFGLATLSHRDTLNTFIGGTSGYISPEEYINETSRMSDIYSLGITFYEAAVGFNPIARALAEYSIQHGDASQDSTRPGQAVTETTTIDFSILSADKRALIEPMLNHNPKKRPSLERLISLADELQVGVASENLDPLDPSKHLAKETVLEEILRVSKDKPLNSLKITVDDSENVQVWLKTKIVEGALALICVKPKNYLGLANLGWKPYQTGTLVLEFDVQPSYETVAKHIEEAITRGYGITRPFTLT